VGRAARDEGGDDERLASDAGARDGAQMR
jgi:hypothetical protein